MDFSLHSRAICPKHGMFFYNFAVDGRNSSLFVPRKLKRQRERLCRFVYNQILTEECTQLNGTWPDPDDPRWNSGEYAELLPDWFPINVTNTSTFGNATTLSTLGNVIEIKLHRATRGNEIFAS
jgi:hypothetical protein